MKRTGILTSTAFLGHETGTSHPESKFRLTSILSKLQEKNYFKELPIYSPRKATKDEIGTIHEQNYIESILKIKGQGYLDGDTPYSPGTLEAALLAAGSGLTLADAMLSGEIDNGIALVRPPGHHAEEDHAMGFCLFNNIAVTAKYLQSKGKKKIFILDWDVHHGNGTQNAFYEDDTVFFLSLHQFPFYPGSGRATEIGEGKGKGFTLNVPLPRGSGNSEYKKAFETQVLPAIDRFAPDCILISAGFDAHKLDPLAGMELSSSAYEDFTQKIKEKAKEFCNGNILSFLEGGYNLEALAESVEVHLSVLL